MSERKYYLGYSSLETLAFAHKFHKAITVPKIKELLKAYNLLTKSVVKFKQNLLWLQTCVESRNSYIKELFKILLFENPKVQDGLKKFSLGFLEKKFQEMKRKML